MGIGLKRIEQPRSPVVSIGLKGDEKGANVGSDQRIEG